METSLDFKRDIKRIDFQVGEFTVVPARDLLLNHNRKYSLEPLVMDLLCILAERPGHVMKREELIDRLWHVDHGGDESLTRAVSMLRKTLRSAGAGEDYIETIPKRGYRLRHHVSNTEVPDILENQNMETIFNKNKGSLLPAVLVVLILTIPIVVVAAIGN